MSANSKPLQRAAFAQIYERGGCLSVVGDDGRVHRFSGASAELVRTLLEHLNQPRTRGEVRSHIAELAGDDANLAVVDQALDALEQSGAVTAPAPIEPPTASGRVVVALSGGIAAAHSPAFVELLLERGFTVRVAATENALRFVSELALEALTHAPVVHKLWPTDPGQPVPHLELAGWAELMVIYPATATTLSRIARGDCSTLVSTVAISTRAPVVLVPAMNEVMYQAPAVQRNLAQLRDDGFVITHPARGYEVADDPEQRREVFGAAPPLDALLAIVDAVRSER